MQFDHLLVARILLSLMTVGYGIVPVRADFNATHATNPLWTPHARFHVVWQVSSYTGLALLALGLIWTPGSLATERLYIAAAMGAFVYLGFFIALFAMPLYGGRAYDDNGYLPFDAPLPGLGRKWDANITVFSLLVAVLIAGTVSI